jgi:hypothetical protein
VCCRLNRLVHLFHELRKPISGTEHAADLIVLDFLDHPGLEGCHDFGERGSLIQINLGGRDLVYRVLSQRHPGSGIQMEPGSKPYFRTIAFDVSRLVGLGLQRSR